MNNTPDYDNIGNSVPYYPSEKKKYNYTTTHGIFALLTFVLGTLWYRWLFMFPKKGLFSEYRALGITVFTLLFFGITLSFFKARNKTVGKDGFIIMCATLIFSLRFAIYPTDRDSFIAFLSSFVLHVCALLFLYCVGTKNALDRIIGSVIMCVFSAPFSSFHRIFTSLSVFLKFKTPSTDEEKQKSKRIITNLSLILITLFCIIPIIALVMSLLFSDGFFSDFLHGIFDFMSGIHIDFNLTSYLNPITILVSMYIFGAMFSSEQETKKPLPDSQNFSAIPVIVSKTVIISLLVIYTLFMAAQVDGFTHMFMGKLPDGVTYAEFARSGFFEICAVACINGGVLFLLEKLTVKETSSPYHSITKILLVVFTILLIFTAAAKMTMYICAYGFTPKRFYTLWFMLLLTVLFVMSFFKFKNTEFKLSRYSVYITLAFLAVLFLIDFDGLSIYLNGIM